MRLTALDWEVAFTQSATILCRAPVFLSTLKATSPRTARVCTASPINASTVASILLATVGSTGDENCGKKSFSMLSLYTTFAYNSIIFDFPTKLVVDKLTPLRYYLINYAHAALWRVRNIKEQL